MFTIAIASPIELIKSEISQGASYIAEGIALLMKGCSLIEKTSEHCSARLLNKILQTYELPKSEIKFIRAVGNVTAKLPCGVVPGLSQIKALASKKMEECLSRIVEGDTQEHIDTKLKEYREELKAQQPPEPAPKQVQWKYNKAGGGRRLIVEMPDSPIAQQIAAEYDRRKLPVINFFQELLRRDVSIIPVTADVESVVMRKEMAPTTPVEVEILDNTFHVLVGNYRSAYDEFKSYVGRVGNWETDKQQCLELAEDAKAELLDYGRSLGIIEICENEIENIEF